MRKKATQKGLQKFTFKQKLERVLNQEIITYEDIKDFDSNQRKIFIEELEKIRKSATSETIGAIYLKIETFFDQDTRNKIWEGNHYHLTQLIHKHLNDHNMMPTKDWLEKESRLSRPTIDKHLKDLASESYYKEYLTNIKVMTPKVISTLLNSALNGDVKASKLFLEITGQLNREQANPTYIKNQNNYLQINNTRLTEEAIKNLPQEKLLQIEELINGKVP